MIESENAESSVFTNGEQMHLTPIEYKLLCLLARNIGKVSTLPNIFKLILV